VEAIDTKRKIVEIAARIEAGAEDLLVGCRKIAELRCDLDDGEIADPDIMVFVAVDSELDGYPFGSSRNHWAADVLAEKDARMNEYHELVRDVVLSACRAIRLKWGIVD